MKTQVIFGIGYSYHVTVNNYWKYIDTIIKARVSDTLDVYLTHNVVIMHVYLVKSIAIPKRSIPVNEVLYEGNAHSFDTFICIILRDYKQTKQNYF